MSPCPTSEAEPSGYKGPDTERRPADKFRTIVDRKMTISVVHLEPFYSIVEKWDQEIKQGIRIPVWAFVLNSSFWNLFLSWWSVGHWVVSTEGGERQNGDSI